MPSSRLASVAVLCIFSGAAHSSLVNAASSLLQRSAVPLPAQRLGAWSDGKIAWEAARESADDRKLWDQPNACDPRALRSSAPLTVLFGLSSIWNRIRKRREAEGLAAKPLEVHVLGAGYPFEGRSDWSLLSSRRPANVPSVRVTLVLGTPFQSDNVPPMSGQKNALLGVSSQIDPTPGNWSTRQEEILCKGEGHWGTREMDQNWSKADLCRDHGNGLEVVCIEKFYQDVRTELPKPDVAVMFSPGFPQLGRRSWDDVLIGLLHDKVPMLISDVVMRPTWGRKLLMKEFGSKIVLPGGRWSASKEIGEDWQTWLAMQKYGALNVRARRGPFPILHREDGEVLAKNAVVQIYQGFKDGKKPTQPLPVAHIEKYSKEFSKVNWKKLASRRCSGSELKRIFKLPTSRAFDNAVRDMYKDEYRRHARKRQASFSAKQRARLESYGLLKSDQSKRWGLKAWVFILKTLGCQEY